MKALRFQLSHHADALAAMLLTWAWTALFFPTVVFQPNRLLLASSRDSVKNIYTLAWQLAHGKTLSWEFSGMGWPFTEHVFYTDGHPLLSWVLGGFVPELIPSEWTAGIVHIAIIASWGLTASILVKILAIYGVRGRWVVIFCSLLPLCHPQLLRWTGHYAMAYSYAIPLAWYIQLKWMEKTQWKWAWLQCVHLIVLLLTHAYLGAIAAALAGLIAGFHVLFNWKSTIRLTVRLLQIATASVLPLIAYIALLKTSDNHPFRTDQPYGFWDNISTWNAALLPSHGGFGIARREFGWGLNAWEGWGFWGAGTWLVILVFIAEYLRRSNPRLRTINWAIVLVAFSSITLYAIGAGEPFLTGKNQWLEKWPLFMQFRAIGRFVWPAAWVMPVLAALGCFHLATVPRLKWLPYIFVGMFALDAFWMQQECKKEMQTQQNCFASVDTELQAIVNASKKSKAVAIHPVPWFQMGSESVGREGSVRAHRQTLAASFHTGLPTTAAHLTRTSISESRLLAEWMAHPGLTKNLLNQFEPSDYEKVVLLYACDDASTWSDDDHLLWQRANLTDDAAIRTLTVGQWLKENEALNVWVQANKGDSDVATNGLNEEECPFALEGSGAKRGIGNEYILIETLTPDSTWLGKTIEASCWFFHDTPHAGRDALQFEWVMEAKWPDDSGQWVRQTPVASSGDHSKGWTRASLRYHLEELPTALHCFAVGFGESPDTVWADAFRAQFVPEESVVYKSSPFTQGTEENSP